MTSPGAHGELINLLQVTKDRFEEAMQAMMILMSHLDQADSDAIIWRSLSAADDSIGGAVGAAHAAFQASPAGQQAMDRILRCTQDANDAIQDARILLHQAFQKSEDGRNSTLAGIGFCEEYINLLHSMGNG